MTEQVSALLDGELSDRECGAQIELLRNDQACRETWAVYHLIGDVMRGHADPGCARTVSAKLAAEPVVLCPGALRGSRKGPAWTAVSVAASVAAVAFVAWTALPMMSAPSAQIADAGNTTVAIATSQPVPKATSPIARVGRPNTDRGAAPSSPVPAAGGMDVDNYLLAHQQFSPSNAIQGVAPYVRLVSDDQP